MNRESWTDEKLFDRLLNNKTQKTYWNNVSELRKRANENIFQKAYGLAKSNDDKEKEIGIDILAQLGFNPRFKPKEVIELFFELLNKPQSDTILMSVLYGIGHNNESLTDNQIAILTVFKTNNNNDVKHGLISALSGLDNSRAIQALVEFTEDKIASIRSWSTFAIGTRIEVNNVEISNALWNRINDSDEETKFEAISGLANRRDSRVKGIIFRELKKESYGSLLFEAILTLNDKDFLPLLEANLKISQNENNVNNGWRYALQGAIEELKNAS
jgi:hypothetical protein